MRKTSVRFLLSIMAAAMLTSGCATSYNPNRIVPMGDRELAEEVSRRLDDDDITGRYPFGVSAMAGSITLRGTVPNESVRRRAISIILGTQGVREVVDETYP